MPVLAEGPASWLVAHCLASELIPTKACDLAPSSKVQGPDVCLIPGFGPITLSTIIGGWPRAPKGSRGNMPVCEW